MGGPSSSYPNQFDYYTDVAQQQMGVYDNTPQQIVPYIEIPEENLSQEIINTVIDYGGGWYLLGFAILGALSLLKPKIKKWLQS